MPPVDWQSAAVLQEESDAKRPRRSRSHQYASCDSQYYRRSTQSCGGLPWSSADIALSARLFAAPDPRHPGVAFVDQEEKRRVFTLTYDVLRYKSVLNRALTCLNFFTKHPHLKERRCHVWLLFFDLYRRDFTPRDVLDPEVDAEFRRQALYEVDEALWKVRVRLAATVSRLRIQNGAHSLSMLLPKHLQQTQPMADQTVITGWVNGFKSSLNEVCKSIESLGISALPRDADNLYPMTYKTDHLLPRFLHIMPAYREDFVRLPIVTSHHLILQERTFCIGPAVMAQLLKDLSLTGIVAQTHVNSMVTAAYLANLLVNNSKIEMLHVFGAGSKKEVCMQYLQQLGVRNTEIHEESFADLSPDNRLLNSVTGVLATPPNTNSSVVDPVDLAVARGGDLEVLQQLTLEDFTTSPSGNSIQHLLVEQKETLRRAMSKPQIQFIVYETHSRFDCENLEMVEELIEELNGYARDAHLEEVRKSQGEKQQEQMEGEQSGETAVARAADIEEAPQPLPAVVVPLSDLFELGTLPDLCPSYEKCLTPESEGTYLAVIKRKEITRLDPKYMIQMAEARGLFGRTEGAKPKQPSGQSSRTKAALAALQQRSDSCSDRRASTKIEVDRIAAPTRSSFLKDSRTPVHVTDPCPRHAQHLSHDGRSKDFCEELRIGRKTPLSPHEEEELIIRLYNSHRISNKSKLQSNDPLPPLKFWESSAEEIETYIRKRVFQKRVQQALGKNKLNCLHDHNNCPNNAAVEALDEEELLSELRRFPEVNSELELLWKNRSTIGKTGLIDMDKVLPNPPRDSIKVDTRPKVSVRLQRRSVESHKDTKDTEKEEITRGHDRLVTSRDSVILTTRRMGTKKKVTTSTQTQVNFISETGNFSIGRELPRNSMISYMTIS